MGHLLDGRRRMIRSRGRSMTLRLLASAGVPQRDVALVGFDRAYRPGELEGGIAQGDEQVEILNDEIAAAGFPAPTSGMLLIRDGQQVTLQGSRAIREGSAVIGHSLWVRG